MSDATLLEQDARARERALDPTQSFIVQAPAGSGKTELLTQRYLRLLATVDYPEQVLAITFTRKAAAEMRARIVKSLQLGSSESTPLQAHTRLTWQLARSVLRKDREREWNLVRHPSRLRIQTIDALTSTLARRLPMLAGIGAALEPVDNATPLYQEAAERLLTRLGDDAEVSAQLDVLILHMGNRLERLIELLVDLLARRDQWLHAVMQARSTTDLRRTIERSLQAVVGHHLQALANTLPPEMKADVWALTQYAINNKLAESRLDDALRALFEHCRSATELESTSRGLGGWRAVAQVFLAKDGNLFKRVDARTGFPASEASVRDRMNRLLQMLVDEREFCTRLEEVRRLPDVEYTAGQWQVLEALLKLLPNAVAELQLVFQRQRRADYVESSLRALRALGTPDEPTDLALAFDHRLRHVLVDEFQDTSFTQLDLLERLTAGWTPGDGRTLFCVGDPMQSIYRFRQAEVGLFIELQQHGLKHLPLEQLTLRRNFRSAGEIVEWVNRTFPTVFPQVDAAEEGAVSYSASITSSQISDGQVHVHASIGGSLEDEAGAVVAAVHAALQRDDRGTVAILVSGRSHLGLIAERLSDAGIEHRAVEIEALRDRPVVQDLIALTRSLVHLGDRTAWLSILRAPWCGLTLDDLHRLAGHDEQSTVRELMQRTLDPRQVAEEGRRLSPDGHERLRRVSSVLDAALEQRSRYALRDWVERTWLSLSGPATLRTAQDLEDARAYLRRLEDVETAGDLDDVTRLEDDLAGLCARPRPQQHARVEIMTIHKAKGLEFDTVILPGLERWVRGTDKPLLRWTRVAGIEDGLILAPLTAAGADPDATYQWLELLEQERQRYERARLLYVAVTRAKRDLHLFGKADVKPNAASAEVRVPRKGTMLSMLWAVVRDVFEQTVQAEHVQSSVNVLRVQSVPLKRLPLEWQAPDADASLKVQLSTRLESQTPERPEFDWASETSRLIGTLVHRELDRVTRQQPVREPPRARVMAELRELGIPIDRMEAAADRVLAAIRNTLNDAKGRWLLGMDGRIREAESEIALSGVIAGQIVNRIIDRSFLDERGTRWVVDFKTSAHEGGGLEDFLATEIERYRPQLVRYAQLMQLYRPEEDVRAALYFPLLKEWREVPLAQAPMPAPKKPRANVKQLDLGF